MRGKANRRAMKASKRQDELDLKVLGTKIDARVKIVKLAKSDAGGAGFSFKKCCASCGNPVKSPSVCLTEGCENGGKAIRKTDTKNGWPTKDGLVYLSHEQVDALNVPGDNIITICETIAFAGIDPNLFRLMGNNYALVPVGNEKTFFAIRALLHEKAGVATIMRRRNFCHALVWASPTGCLMVQELFLGRDAYDVPKVDAPIFAPKEREALAGFVARGEEMLVDAATGLDEDPFREAREALVMTASREQIGKGPIVAVQEKSEETKLTELL